jgi:hypothetical protein
MCDAAVLKGLNSRGPLASFGRGVESSTVTRGWMDGGRYLLSKNTLPLSCVRSGFPLLLTDTLLVEENISQDQYSVKTTGSWHSQGVAL